ncbi:ABC transporter substrate-binding protein [Paraflavitalea speifideaquila]|uniref:ABC transporter substrate-binding protein n=1 Tax=Paraflavitalea speifideaquila TaxID=3076558 RepID=UPI0028ECF0A6|nr:ABC transporter substrate-binding protein [Paraflavitalea speifideiaquila]
MVDSSNPLVKNSPLRLKAIRQAINYGFDRRKMMMYLRNSIGTPAESGFIPSGLPSFDSSVVKGYPYDPVKARRLLREAGFPDGQGMPPVKLLTIAIYSDLASFIARQLEEVGLKIQVEVVQKSLLLEQTAKSQALFFRGSWMADYPEAENYLSVFMVRIRHHLIIPVIRTLPLINYMKRPSLPIMTVCVINCTSRWISW